MQQILSSDTNIWIDFATIDALALPFKLPKTFIMFEEAIRTEMVSPAGPVLQRLGLIPVEITDEEFFLAQDLLQRYARLSPWDCIALAIAKERQIEILTGDKRLRAAASEEGVTPHGSLWILDELLKELLVSRQQYEELILRLLNDKTGKIRLPKQELERRLTLSTHEG